jgi:hypothetical protein
LALEPLIETFSVSEYLQCCSASIPDLERALAKKKGVPLAEARAEFGRFMNGLITEKRTAASLTKVQIR